MTERALLDQLRSHDQLLAAFAEAVEADYAATLRLTAGLPAADRDRTRQKRRGAYVRALRQTLRTVAMLRDGERC